MYKKKYKPNHPNSAKDGLIQEHRLIMSEYLDRPLRDNEVVHHIDGDKENNDLSNLEVLDWHEHNNLHAQERIDRSRTPEAIAKKKETFRKNKHAQGKRNSQYGTMWITNGIQNRKLKANETMPEEFYKGRK